jgi:hypothetical protein
MWLMPPELYGGERCEPEVPAARKLVVKLRIPCGHLGFLYLQSADFENRLAGTGYENWYFHTQHGSHLSL